MATIDDLKTKANLVANATEVGENTAQRVGGALQNAADLIASLITRADSNDTVHSDIQKQIAGILSNIATETSERQSNDTYLHALISDLDTELNTVIGDGSSTKIENFKEVLSFLDGIKDTDTLTAMLTAVQKSVADNANALSDLKTSIGKANGIVPLDVNGLIPSAFMPESADDVVMVEKWGEGYGVTITPDVGKYNYNTSSKKLYLGVSTVNNGATVISYVEVTLSEDKIYICLDGKHIPYIWSGTNMVPIAAEDAPASIFNATILVPISGYYVLCDTDNTSLSAVHAAWNANKATGGLIISFELSAGIWKTYQYVGKTVTEANWYDVDNWKDFGSLADGSEPYIIIDSLPQQSKVGDYYTLETAVASLIYCQQKTSVTYAKKGLIISYSTAANTMETKQFQGEVADIAETGLWKDFGGGGSKVVTKDVTEKGGADALSTGGAFNLIPTDVKNEVDGTTLKTYLVREDGTQIGDGSSVTLPSGGGTLTGTIVSIAYKDSPLYVKSGSEVIINAAIRSVTTQGTTETDNIIEKLELVDRDTNQVLETINVNQSSSASLSTFDFKVNVTSYFATAGQRRFKIVAYDDAGNSGSKNINVTSVDVGIQSVQTLNYTQTTVLSVGGSAKTLPMYKFPNNASDKGILATTEIYINNSWKKLGEATVLDTYSHSVTIDPANCLGTALSHGAYPLRIHGVDVGSGVVGNYLHTSVMVVDESVTTPIIVTRWYTDSVDGVKKLYETINVDFAVYSPSESGPTAVVLLSGTDVAERIAYRSQTYTFSKKVTDVKYDGSVTLSVVVKCGTSASQETDFLISGTLLAIEEVKTQRQFSLDFSSRSNNEASHIINDNGVTVDLNGINWSTNGFVTDNFGTSAESGDMALRIAENATGTLHYSPFNDKSIETNGMAIQFTLMKKNIADDSRRLISCIKDGFGFYVDGNNVVFTFDNGATVAHTITAALDDGEKTNVAIVIEPNSIAPYTGIGAAKMFFDGEEVGSCYYEANSIIAHETEIAFDGSEGDLYLYNIKAWKTYFEFEQSFNNYLLTMTDTDAMISEYEFNQVMGSVTAENTTKNRPLAQKLYDIGIAYFVICKNSDTADNDAKDNYPEYLETLDGDKKTKRLLDWYAYFPARPWQDFKVLAVPTVNQGTTSSLRPIKNIKGKFKRLKIILLHTEADFSGTDLDKFKACEVNAANGLVQISDDSLPTNIITVKVDYSESGGANNGASTQLYNDMQRALGESYRTPAQNAYTGSYILNSSINSIPCAFFRTDRYSPDATSPSYGYFHAKANWNEDKGDAKIFGFEGVAGYNAACLNYGGFTELVSARNQSLTDFSTAVDKSAWDNTKVYVLSEFCGPLHKVYRYEDGAWKETTGTMTYTNNQWVITGDVVNPVENYEMLKYDSFDWFQGCNSIDDLLALDPDGKPIWLQYFESRYPDNDALNALYESGKKVPYYLYQWLRFCQDCNHHLTDGNITIAGATVTGTAANRLKKWKQELHTVANVHSVLCYHIFTDYIAAVDQRSKNMMLGFYLDKDGVVRLYLNHLYDGDTVMGCDNDCGLKISSMIDPNNDPGGVYQGHDSVLFTQIAAMGTDSFWIDDTGNTTVTTREVAQAMRTLTLKSGLIPFSYAGIVKYWVTDRLSKWPKLVSSFDGERKYIEHSKDTANYFYALHGLSIQRLKDFVKTRFLYRDGFYQTGDLYSSAVSMRATGTNVVIKITAAKEGYFGIGVDRANVATDSCYLKAGESYTLKSGMTNTGSGTMLYVFGASRLLKLDISGCTPSPASWDISQLTLVQELVVGGAGYTLTNNNEGYLTNLNLGNLPYLKNLDIRNTAITTVNSKYCPRLVSVLATGSQLTKITLAEASAITTLALPTTYKNLTLRYLPSLTNDGITFANAASVDTLIVEGCTKLDAWSLLMLLAKTSGTALKYVRVTNVNEKGDGSDLTVLKSLGLLGVDSTLTAGGEVAITGRYVLSKYTADETLSGWRTALPELTIDQQPYSIYKEFDNTKDSQNLTNLDNSTGYDYGTTFVPSGHIIKIREKSVPVKGKFNSSTGKMKLTKISEKDYTKFSDGTAFDNKDSLGEQYDLFKYLCNYWYKGINDFVNQCKYTCLSSNKAQPDATWTKKNELSLSEALYADAKGIPSSLTAGTTFADSMMADLSSCAVYRLDVEGMKQARYIGLNNSSYGAIFVNSAGVVLECDVLAISGIADSPLDFKNENGDYIFRSVPSTAKYLYFTCIRGLSDEDHPIFSVDSSEIEAIEPGWVKHKSTLIGVYGGTIDDLGLLRSISGKVTKRGNGTPTTSTKWTYDADGNPTNMPVGTMNYTFQDLLNLCAYRGKGYHSISYEQSKDMAVLSKCYSGNRDDQRVYGFGCGADYTTGGLDSIGNGDTAYGAGLNKVWGLEGFIACMYEVMDNVGVNVSTFAAWKAAKRTYTDGSMPINAKWHIYDGVDKTERVVQGITNSGYEIARVKHGKYCDVIASSVNGDNSAWSTCYAAVQWYSNDRGPCVGRAYSNAYAGGGLVYASASGVSADSNSVCGVRLAFDGPFENESEIDEDAA